ncbi:MAG: M20/M25/M40 family metallo-hydrolase [Deltaproteobacteria bacterium]|nr:M20/M25/M40 family metallo-hydrolase [Deltaproteobacteria bacterium]
MSERMVRQFMEMVAIDSESGNEARMMEYLLKAIREVGGEAGLDAYGNLIAKFPAQGCQGKEPILLSCHADTVKPGVGIKPVLENGVVRSGGDTILGADDKAGIAEVLEALRTSTVRPPVEFAVSRQEETGLQGVKNMDFSRLTAKRGFLMDNDTLDTIVIGGPSYFAIDVKVLGRAAHAGMEPEKGLNAIQAAAKAIAALRLGRLDAETTANVGVIQGGLIRNGVPETCTFLAECRSANHEKGLRLSEEMVQTIRTNVEAAGAKVEISCSNLCRAVRIAEDAPTVRIAQQALRKVGIEAKPIFITGFTDASIYNNQGIEIAVVGIGAQNEHTTRECVAVADMEKAVVVLHEALRICAG